MKDTIIKAIVYRIIIVVTQTIFLYLFTGSLELASTASIVFAFIATIIHIIFERLWNES